MDRTQARKQDDLLSHFPIRYVPNDSRTGEGVEWYAPKIETDVLGMGFAAFTIDGEITALDFVHLRADRHEQCGGFLWTKSDYSDKIFTVVQEEPLTLSPSLLCPRCGIHGRVINGKWVPA